MKVTGATIQQLDRLRKDGSEKPKSECRKWRLWATTEQGRKSKRIGGTYSQAQKELKRWVAELEGVVPNAETFGAYAASWLAWRAGSGDFSPNTVAGESTCVRALSRSPIGAMRMDEIRPDDCRGALSWLASNPVHGDSLKRSTVARLHQVLGAIMRQAVADGRLADDPMAHVRRPKAEKPGRDALSPDELQLFLNRVDLLPLDGRSVALYLMACLGLRCGEACALRDDEVAGGIARVRSTVRAADGSIGPPKSESGKRDMPVPERLAAKVAEWRAARDALGLRDAPTLCCSASGGVMAPRSLSNWWRGGKGQVGAREKLGCPGMTMHELRHSNLSMMARHMSVFDLQRWAGWSSIEPARIYVHDDMDSVARAVSDAWGARERTKNAPIVV